MLTSPSALESELQLRQRLVGPALGLVQRVVVAQVVVELELGRLREEQVEAGRVRGDLVAALVDVRVEAVEADERLVGLGPPVVEASLLAEARDELLAEAQEE